MIKVCCVCKKMQSADRWVQATLSDSEMVTHGYCPDCFEVVMQEIEAYMSTHGTEPAVNDSVPAPIYT